MNNYLQWELQPLVPYCVRRNQGGSLFCHSLYSALHWQVMPLVPPVKQNCNGASLRTFQHVGMAVMKWEFCFLSQKPQGWNSPSNPELWKTQVQKPNGGVHSEKKNTAAASVYIYACPSRVHFTNEKSLMDSSLPSKRSLQQRCGWQWWVHRSPPEALRSHKP